MLRQHRPHRADGAGAATGRGQTGAGAGEGVPEGRDPHRGPAGSRGPSTGTPQGGILSPLLANIALSVLDEHFTAAVGGDGPDSSARHRRRRRGAADLSARPLRGRLRGHGPRHPGARRALRDEVAAVLAPMGLRLSEEKTRICHIDEGFDFLGFRIQRQPKRGSGKPTVYTYPSKKASGSVKSQGADDDPPGTHQPLAALLHRLAPVLRGWANYFRHGVSKATFDYLRRFTWRRVFSWLRRKHRRPTGNGSAATTCPGGGHTDGDVALFDPQR